MDLRALLLIAHLWISYDMIWHVMNWCCGSWGALLRTVHLWIIEWVYERQPFLHHQTVGLVRGLIVVVTVQPDADRGTSMVAHGIHLRCQIIKQHKTHATIPPDYNTSP